jgi:hypothetical protein
MPRALALRLLVPALIAFAVLAAEPAIASPPSATFSTFDPCLVVCPAGDIVFHTVIRDGINNPIPNSLVTLDFSRCPMFVHCAGIPAPLIVNDAARTIARFSDGAGVADFAIPMGGICPGSTVYIAATVSGGGGGVLVAMRSLASPDRDGNLSVDAADQAAIQALVGITDPTADLNCDGAVTAADVALVGQHLGHMCASPTPSRSRSWGGLKLIYR